jgi:antitoxin StbD
MITISISQLKTNPSSVIAAAVDYPVMVENRKKAQAYVVGKALFEKMITLLEDRQDAAEVKVTDFSKGRDFEDVAKELGL